MEGSISFHPSLETPALPSEARAPHGAAGHLQGALLEESSWRPRVRPGTDESPSHFVVAESLNGWVVQLEGVTVACRPLESEALSVADKLARSAHAAGCDSRVLRQTSAGQLHLERSYGRHPLVRKLPS